MFLTLLPFGACAFIGQFGEGVITDWATVLMNTELNSGPTMAAVGFACYSATMAITRLSGDWLVTKFGRPQILLSSSACASFGLFVLALAPHYVVAWIGCAIAGIGRTGKWQKRRCCRFNHCSNRLHGPDGRATGNRGNRPTGWPGYGFCPDGKFSGFDHTGLYADHA
jgi:predicted MFS family arabinose efflux permease